MKLIEQGTKKAQEKAEETMNEVKSALKINYFN